MKNVLALALFSATFALNFSAQASTSRLCPAGNHPVHNDKLCCPDGMVYRPSLGMCERLQKKHITQEVDQGGIGGCPSDYYPATNEVCCPEGWVYTGHGTCETPTAAEGYSSNPPPILPAYTTPK